ncbi:MAG TPA: hypothetical protein VIS06_07085 [Mycobacteriales bacterium]
MTDARPQAAFSEDIRRRPTTYSSVATLADEPVGLTCSVAVGRVWGSDRADSLAGYPSFELAAQTVKSGQHDVLLVPSAYPDIRSFFFDPQLEAVESFLQPLPDMVLAVPEAVDPEHLDLVFHHPATTALVERISDRVTRAVLATSNSAACRMVLEHHGAVDPTDKVKVGAVTNQLCSDHYGLRTVEVLAAGTAMCFVVFRRKDSGGRQYG